MVRQDHLALLPGRDAIPRLEVLVLGALAGALVAFAAMRLSRREVGWALAVPTIIG